MSIRFKVYMDGEGLVILLAVTTNQGNRKD